LASGGEQEALMHCHILQLFQNYILILIKCVLFRKAAQKEGAFMQCHILQLFQNDILILIFVMMPGGVGDAKPPKKTTYRKKMVSSFRTLHTITIRN
jgi:hypothetical protein